MKISENQVSLALMASVAMAASAAAQTVYVSRMWHNHQPLYWPEWNSRDGQTSRVEYAWDSIQLKPGRSYAGSTAQHPENNLADIFGLDDRRNAYQWRPKQSLDACPSSAGFVLSYSGSLIDNIRQLGGGGRLGYGSDWADGNRQARAGGRLDLVGFTYHHSLAPLLPKGVLRKEIQIFKQAWWKAWNGNPNQSDHSKGFFPTEMAFSTGIVDVLADEGYQWAIVASHHLSRTCPTYFNNFDLANNRYGIFSSPPNRADLLGPSPSSGWWYSEPNPGNAAWNVSPFAYQLHRVKHVNPETGAEKSILVVPSDDVLSYRYGYANEGIGKIQSNIAPHANDPARPVIVMPASDGDNAWGGGHSSWMEATPQFFNSASGAGYQPTGVQAFVNAHGAAAGTVHIEDGAWIFPESDYGSPYFLKWIEPPVAATAATRYPGTVVDMETPGFALKFWAWAPVVTGANWVETAEQVLRDEGGSVEPWRIQAPYDWDGSWSAPNEVELAWHIYLGGLDSGFNYYGGLGNDDEVKAALATTRAIQKLQPWMTPARRDKDRTPPSVLKPQRFPHNPGGHTFGWFNSIPGGDNRYLKKMPSEFYVWTHAYDLSGVQSVQLKVRIDNDGVNTLSNNQNETHAGGGDVGPWISLPMTKRALPNSTSALNAAANNGQINYFITPPELADYYFAKITDANVPGFKGKLLDYRVEATDEKGNVHKSEIQHVFVEDGGTVEPPAPGEVVTIAPAAPTDSQPVTITYDPAGRNLAAAPQVYLHIGRNDWKDRLTPRPAMTLVNGKWQHVHTPPAGTTVLDMVFTSAPEGGSGTWDNNNGADWHFAVTPGTANPPASPGNLTATAVGATSIHLDWDDVAGATSYVVSRDGTEAATPAVSQWSDSGLLPASTHSYTVKARNGNGDSAAAGPVSATTGGTGTPPAAPADLTAAATGTTSIALDWGDVAGAADYVVSRDGAEIGVTLGSNWLDTGLTPSTWYSYTVKARNAAGESAASSPAGAATQDPGGGNPLPFVMDGTPDSAGYLLSNPGMTIHAAVRGGTLYVATWSPGAFPNDHFILVGSSVLASASTVAPWAKAGTTAAPAGSPFLGAESTNSYIGWSHTNGAATTAARGAPGAHMEGTIDLAGAFAGMPADLHLAALSYQTADGGVLGGQAPAGNGNGSVEAAEFLHMPLEALRDEDANGSYDRLEAPSPGNPHGKFRITSLERPAADRVGLTWNAFPGRVYQIEASDTLAPGAWNQVPGAEVTAGPGDLELTVELGGQEATSRFYRVALRP